MYKNRKNGKKYNRKVWYKLKGETMKQEQLKNMVVIKNLPSNIIDEAFVILKNNKKIKSLERIEINNISKETKEKKDDYIIKEAEMVISNFLTNIEKEKQHKEYNVKQIEEKYKRLKIITVLLSIIILINAISSIW